MNGTKLSLIFSAVATVIGLIFLGLSIFMEPAPRWALPTALLCVTTANFLNLLRGRKKN